MKAEIKNLQEENQSLETNQKRNKILIQNYESQFLRKKELKIVFCDSFQILASLKPSIPNTKNDTKIVISTFNSLEPEKIIKRQSLKTNKANLIRFFKFINIEMKNSKIKVSKISSFIKALNSNQFTLNSFLETLNHFSIKPPLNEIIESFDILSNNKSFMNTDEFIQSFENQLNEFNSSNSSDISSISSQDIPMRITIKKNMNEFTGMILDHIGFHLLKLGVSKGKFLAICEEKLPKNINLADFSKFLYDLPFLDIENDDKSVLATNLMNGCENKSRDEILDKILPHVFKYEDATMVDEIVLEEILTKIRKKKEFFMAKFEEIDGKTGFLSWDQIIDVFHDNNTILFEEIDQLEYYCYLLNNSLKKIPYDVLLKEKISEVTERPSIKAFIRKKTSLRS